MTKKIAIFGGSGFIGTRLSDRLINRSDLDFTILDLITSPKYPNKTQICDIRDPNSVKKCLNNEFDIVINLAAEHKDNIQPTSRYYDTNVGGFTNICAEMENLGIESLIFTSSVAVYGFVEKDTDEFGTINPFHAYGDSKYKGELVGEQWFNNSKQLSIIRPTVVFGEGNKGNVYNLLRQIASGKFLMIGSGNNKKSMAYVENIAGFIEHLIDHGKGRQVFNYIDKPDFTMNELAFTVNQALGKQTRSVRIPRFVGLLAGYFFDFIAKVFNKELPISSIRVKKFCAITQFKTSTDYAGFQRPVSLRDGLIRTVKSDF